MIKVGIFSGRFDPPNSGHFMTIERLLKDFHYLLVPILDYANRTGCTAIQAKKIFEHHFNLIIPEMFRNRLKFVINTDHFAEITLDEYYKLLKDNDLYDDIDKVIYLAGNETVLKNFEGMGMKCQYVSRVTIDGIHDQYIFESTKIREQMKAENKNIDEIYNITLIKGKKS